MCGVEIDGYGIYSDLYSRYDHAQAYVDQANGDGDRVEYRVDDFVTSHYGKMDIVTLFYPFILEEALRSWGLPRRYFEPRNLLAKALSLLDVGGALIVTHDRYFIEQFADRVLEVVDGGVRLVGVRSGQAGPGVGPQ